MFEKNSLKKRIFAAIIAGTMIMSLSLTGCSNDDGTEESSKSGNASSTSEVSETSVVPQFGGNISVKSQNFSVPLPIMAYLFNYNYQSYLNYYETYMTAYYDFDASVDLKEQYYDESTGETWYDFFMDKTIEYISETLILAEAAKAEGMELDESELQAIDDNMQSLAETAESKEMTVEEYITKYYGEDVTQEYIEECLKLTSLAQKYYNKVYNGYEYSDEEYEAYYEENKTSYQYADFLVYSFNVEYGENATDEEIEAADEKAKAYADALSNCKTEDEFKAYVKDYLEQNPDIITSTSTSSTDEESSMTDEEIEAAIEEAVENILYEKYSYEVSSDVGTWVFDDSRKELDTTIVNGTDVYNVVMMIKTAYRDESTYKNVRHILIKTSSYDTDEEAEAKANEVYQEWKDGEATEETFAELAEKYSEDGGSNTNGGLYENIYQGQMVTEFNDWCFDSSRKAGDTGIVKTSYGYHIMYFLGDTEAAWKVDVDEDMRSADFNEDYQALQDKYTVELDEDYLNTIKVFETSSEESGTTSE